MPAWKSLFNIKLKKVWNEMENETEMLHLKRNNLITAINQSNQNQAEICSHSFYPSNL